VCDIGGPIGKAAHENVHAKTRVNQAAALGWCCSDGYFDHCTGLKYVQVGGQRYGLGLPFRIGLV
jgi:hypothetical protein